MTYKNIIASRKDNVSSHATDVIAKAIAGADQPVPVADLPEALVKGTKLEGGASSVRPDSHILLLNPSAEVGHFNGETLIFAELNGLQKVTTLPARGNDYFVVGSKEQLQQLQQESQQHVESLKLLRASQEMTR